MNLAYVAANYFIEVLFRSPNHTINFDNLKIFRKLITKEVCPAVAAYLDRESQDDFLFIFRKFPDVFLRKPDAITFTDTFTFLHDHLDSYEFYFNGAPDIRTVLYLENFAVGYFSQCLKKLGPQHYLSLFTMLVHDETNQFSSYFRLQNDFDAQIFFEVHADVFLLYNDIVSLREEKLLLMNPLLNKTLAPDVMVQFEDSVYFLLTCFKSLHYIELRQCICYAFTSVKNVLNRFPVIKQRELFEILPHLNMTELGYLSLKYMDVNISITSLDKTILFIVCLLAFKKSMHFRDIKKEINRRLPSTSNCLKGFNKTAFVQFFRNLSALFNMSKGCVTLLPTFIFPIFTADICIPQNDNDALKPVDISQSDHSISSTSRTAIKNSDAKSLDDDDTLQFQVVPSLQTNNLLFIDSNCKHFLSTFILSENINKRIRLSILFLLMCFDPVDKKCVFITVFYVMDEVRNAFCSLSTSDKCLFISYCSQFIVALSDKEIRTCIVMGMFEGMEKEILLLFTAYSLTNQKEIHFQEIVKSLHEKKINKFISSLSVSEQYKYFQEMKKYIKMGNNGYISLGPPFELIKENVNSYTDFLSERCCTDNSEMLKITSKMGKVLETEISTTVSEILNCSLPVTGHKVPLDVRKTLLTAHHLCKRYVPGGVIRRIFEVSVFILHDLRKYVYNLPVNEQNDFVNECYEFMLKARSSTIMITEEVFCVVDISDEERDNLFMAYLLTGSRTNNHIHGFINKLRERGICQSLTLKNYEDQFKFFEKTSQYFNINSKGYITFHPSFNHLKLLTENSFSKSRKKQGKACCFNPNPIEYQMKHIKMPVKNNHVINSSTSEAILLNIDNDVVRKNTIIDLCVFILSSTKQIPIEKLCHQVNTCKIPLVEDFFSLYTVYEKAKFFKDLSEYFEVSPDNFVILKENVIDSYVPKANLNHLGKSYLDYKEMTERSPSGSAVLSVMSELSEPRSAPSNNLCGKKKQAGVRKKSQSMTNKKRNAAKGKVKEKAISMPHGMNNNIVEGKIICNSSIKQDPLRNIPALTSMCDVPSSTWKSKISSDISKASKSIAVNSQQLSKKMLQKMCNAKDFNSTTFVSNIASDSSNMPVSSAFNGTSESSTKNASEANFMCTMQDDHLSEINNFLIKETKASESNSKLAYETIFFSKQKSSHQTVSCDKKLNPQSEEKHSKFDQDHTNNANKKSSEENNYSDYRSILNKKSSPGNKISRSDKGMKDLPLRSSSSEMPSKSKHTEDLSAETASNINSGPIFNSFKIRMPTQKSSVTMFLQSTTESSKNYYNFSNDGVPYSPSIECYTSSHIISPQKSSVKLCSDFSNASYFEESKSFLDSLNVPPFNTAVECDYQIAKALESNCIGPKNYSLNHSEKPQIVSKQSAIKFKEYNCDSIEEMRAVNFFCVILGNYQKYNCGISADFLKKQLYQASDEVRSVIRYNYENDFLSFFKKHKNEFYVSPQSQDIYLQRKQIKC